MSYRRDSPGSAAASHWQPSASSPATSSVCAKAEDEPKTKTECTPGIWLKDLPS